ncbi:MAG TPA: LytR C-terminal domain-containing protein [Candidatus Saccharimonadales bacterium]|nr:LytR C-terminal domain-containing protein [Candidatus Saccharimonadales bacterium]
MARKSSRRRRGQGRSPWPGRVLLLLAVGLVGAFAGSAALRALGPALAPWAAGPAADASRAQRAAGDPGSRPRLRVEVLNGSGVPGAGLRVAEVLRDGGFRVSGPFDADRLDYGTTLVVDRKGNPRAAREVVEYLHGGYPLLMRSPLAAVDVRVVVGRDHRGLKLTP